MGCVAFSPDGNTVASASSDKTVVLALLEALAGAADADKDGTITFRELRDFVPGCSEALTEGRQHLQLPFLDNYDPSAVLAMVR